MLVRELTRSTAFVGLVGRDPQVFGRDEARTVRDRRTGSAEQGGGRTRNELVADRLASRVELVGVHDFQVRLRAASTFRCAWCSLSKRVVVGANALPHGLSWPSSHGSTLDS